ncbi:AAC(3) family N-acetyltransferase [Campylobacter cuniculorum]|uniref:AAC(3) family N-acetyltransferase n=1 Tax=Campylobacter cuniculorum TaxID=374106 RepID=UPI0023F557DB|nr:AAC(3) family N-acetyltransferase [Campylobacter cuniculorum]
MSDYKLSDLKRILKDNIHDEDIVFIAGNLANLGNFNSTNKLDLLNTFVDGVFEASKNEATIMTQTMSFQICNTNIVFDRYTWSNLGAFGNFLLRLKDSVRSFHPFASYTAFGKNANICDCFSPFAYGINSPYDKMLKFDKTTMISVGMIPHLTCSIVHNAEMNMNVPYRYIKEFYHPMKINGEIVYKNVYLQCLYKELCNIPRNCNVKIFNHFIKNGGIIKEIPLGKDKLYFYDYKAFYYSCIDAFSEDIFVWMSEEPSLRPFRN